MPTIRLFTSFLLLGLALSACAKPGGSAGASASNQDLKEGLLALDQGDDITAEGKLKSSIDLDASNSRARTALASIYAKRAGVGLRQWLDPLLQAGQQIDAKARTYEQLRSVLDQLAATENPAPLSPDHPAETPAESPKDAQMKKDATDAALGVGHVAIGLVIVMDLFESFPFLKPDQMEWLDKAIAVLKKDNDEPVQRKEEVRVYLAILSFVRVVHFSREILGATDEDLRQLFSAKSRACTLSVPDIKGKLVGVRESLKSLSEGLAVAPGEAKNKYRDARRRLHDSLDHELNAVNWDKLDNYFVEGTPENLGAKQMVRGICTVRPVTQASHPAESLPDPLASVAAPNIKNEATSLP